MKNAQYFVPTTKNRTRMPTATTCTQYCIKDSRQDNNEEVGKETKMLHCLKSLKELSSVPLTVKDC